MRYKRSKFEWRNSAKSLRYRTCLSPQHLKLKKGISQKLELSHPGLDNPWTFPNIFLSLLRRSRTGRKTITKWFVKHSWSTGFKNMCYRGHLIWERKNSGKHGPKSLLQKHCLKPSAYLMHFESFHGAFRDLSSSQGELVSLHHIIDEECHDVIVLHCWHMVIFGIQEEG